MNKQVLQIESLDGEALIKRLNAISNEVTDIKKGLTQQPTPTDLLTRKQVADMFSISLVTVNDWTNKKILFAYKVANRVYYKRSEVEASLTSINQNRRAHNG